MKGTRQRSLASVLSSTPALAWLGLSLLLGLAPSSADAQITGRAFRDLDGNGSLSGGEFGQNGVLITVYDSAGTAYGSVTSASCTAAGVPFSHCTGPGDVGFWELTAVGGSAPYRLEAAPATTGNYSFLKSGPAGGTDVQFLSALPVNGLEIGVWAPSVDFCPTPNNLGVACFVVGPIDQDITAGCPNPTPAGANLRDNDAFVLVDRTLTGKSDDPGYVGPTSIARHRDIGSVMGVAHRTQDDRYFTAAFLKRASGFGPAGPGGIYRIDPNGTLGSNTEVWATIPGAGTDPHDLDPGSGADLCDPNTYDQAVVPLTHKMALGDIDISTDGQTLYVINLANKHLYSVPATGTAPVTPVDEGEITAPAGCAADDFRPHGLGVHPDGRVFIASVCTNQSGGSADGIRTYIQRFDAGSFPVEFDFSLDYEVNVGPGGMNWRWIPWNDLWGGFGSSTANIGASATDITFVGLDMVINLRNRFGDLDYNETAAFAAIPLGDTLKACFDEGTSQWSLETSGMCGGVTGSGDIYGPGGGSFFDDAIKGAEVNAGHTNATLGSSAFRTGQPLYTTIIDPWRGSSAGWYRFNTTDGDRNFMEGYEVYHGGPRAIGTFGKIHGLGDLEYQCAPAPLEIGNFVWRDDDGDGVQGPAEPRLAGVRIGLFDSSGNQLAEAVTGPNGEYLFLEDGAANDPTGPGDTSGDPWGELPAALITGDTYTVAVLDANFQSGQALEGLGVTAANNDASPGGTRRDSNGMALTLAGATFQAATIVTIGGPGNNDHTLDFGFLPATPLSLGNRVWFDDGAGNAALENNGVQDPGELGVASVLVELLDAAGSPIDFGSGPVTTVTDGTGHYLFDALPPGDYRVRVAASNFGPGMPLEAWVSTLTAEADPNSDGDTNDNGVDSASPATTGITSAAVTLSAGAEPSGETDLGALGSGSAQDPDSNLTVDFGFIMSTTPPVDDPDLYAIPALSPLGLGLLALVLVLFAARRLRP